MDWGGLMQSILRETRGNVKITIVHWTLGDRSIIPRLKLAEKGMDFRRDIGSGKLMLKDLKYAVSCFVEQIRGLKSHHETRGKSDVIPLKIGRARLELVHLVAPTQPPHESDVNSDA